MNLIMHTPADELRFWLKVGEELETGCWPWEGAANERGYGNVAWGREGQTKPAHQVSLFIAGIFPPGPRYEVDHVVCHFPPCIRPDHLEWVRIDGRENSVRYQASKTHCKHGHEFTPENTYVNVKANGSRSCKQCRRDAFQAYLARWGGRKS